MHLRIIQLINEPASVVNNSTAGITNVSVQSLNNNVAADNYSLNRKVNQTNIEQVNSK